MRYLFLLPLFLCFAQVDAQNQIYSINALPDPLNINLESIDPGLYQIAGDYNTGGFRQGFLSRHLNGNLDWAVDINIDGFETILSDQVLLPDGTTAVTGIYFNPGGLWEPYILLLDPNGNPIHQMGYTGFARPFVATHKILHDPLNERILICGANRQDDPRTNAFSNDQVGFIMSVDQNTLNPLWYEEVENGQSTNGMDYDLVESMEVLSDETLLYTGSMSDQNNPHQRLMIGRLNLVDGSPIFLHHYDLSFGSTEECGADIIQIGFNDWVNTYVLVNATRGLEVICFDLDQEVINSRHRIFELGDRNLTGYQFDYQGGVSGFYLSGYISQAQAGNFDFELIPFSIELEARPDCVTNIASRHFEFPDINNTLPQTNGQYGAVIGTDYLNTPDMFIRSEEDHLLVGYRQNAVDVDMFDLLGGCQNNCIDPLEIEMIPFQGLNPSLVTNTVQGGVGPSTVTANVGPRGEALVLECTFDDLDCADIVCAPTLTQLCATNFELSLDGCIDPCYSPTFTWDIDGWVSPFNSSSIPFVSLGGNHNYTVTIQYVDNRGPQTCTLNGTINIPAFNCNDLAFTVSLDQLGCTDYGLAINTCFPMDSVSWCVELFLNDFFNGCTVANCAPGDNLVFDVNQCGEGWYGYKFHATFSDPFGQSLNCSYWAGNGPYGLVFVADHQLDPPVIDCKIMVGSQNPMDICGGDDYAKVTVISPVGSQYLYQWNNGPWTTNASYVCCDYANSSCWDPSLRIWDTNTNCEYYTSGACTRSPLQDPGAPVVLEKRISETITEQFDVEAYPNPVSDILQIQLQGPGKAQATLYNLQGQTLQQRALYPATSEMDLSLLPAGIYFLQVIDETTGAQITKRIMKI